MTLLVISPDYASHLLPLATLATSWRDAGERVVVATGPATAAIVESFGYERIDLRLGRGSNPGTIKPEDQPPGEDDALRGFFDATRLGMIETLEFQARARLTDLMWQPVETARAVLAVIEAVRPTAIIVDHLAFSARLAMVAGRIAHVDVVLGHPSALPSLDEVYGFPPAWPAAFTPSAGELAELRALCDEVSANFTAEWNGALSVLAPELPASPSAFEEHGDLVLYNYPGELSPAERPLPPHVFLGSAVREEPADDEVAAWIGASGEPFVYVSFGSFLSVRGDVLGRVADALRERGLRAAIATGSSSPDVLGAVPGDWLVRGFLPQVTLLRSASAAVTHAGNNSVTEALTFGVPLVALPFSTDQFAGAAALEQNGYGVALAPNTATVAELAGALDRVLGMPRDALNALSRSLRYAPGASRAREAVTSWSIDSGLDAASR
ncbi:zeaxanthin glucosyltransferase [Microbacteriaceae bacterium SG_E_30_P1]|uniref:Zeaxanthin glucosyltransferase n=1 Tax=Antiquaquibacter oligotrophicus TaxID=2880260 RepID=A0ABT6KM73_9MICO|nr:glycosyltransferase [Antiquaquibacter oligotrophicus]MDH6180207.1 zeaxanthin glucosyltransferase [Antiquaquibacter oligotrophicus]UDF14046.1 glycosyltransferase [Antiquaquibacter oligotrophicus]